MGTEEQILTLAVPFFFFKFISKLQTPTLQNASISINNYFHNHRCDLLHKMSMKSQPWLFKITSDLTFSKYKLVQTYTSKLYPTLGMDVMSLRILC